MDGAEFHPGQYLTFRLGRQEFAIDARRVKGIVPLHDLETGDCGEARSTWFLGYAKLCGAPHPVKDLAAWLGLPRRASGRSSCIVIVDQGALVGFPVDRVCDVILARACDFSHGKIRIGRPRRLLYADQLFVGEHEPEAAKVTL